MIIEENGQSPGPDEDESIEVGGDMRVIVVGSGFGGAVTACRLAQAGFDVVILERGRRYGPGNYPNLPQDDSLLPDTRRWDWNADQGLWEVLDLDEMVSVQGAGYGGGSLVYANVHLRPPREVFDSAWPKVFQNRTALDEYFDLVASMLEVSPVDEHHAFHEQLIKSAQMKEAAKALRRDVFYPPLAIRYPKGSEADRAKVEQNAHGVPQGTCTGCGQCCTGCPQAAKNTLDLNYLAIAERHGAKVQTQCEVLGLVETGGGEWIVRCFDHLEARRRSFRARHVFLCAGSIHSTRLMASAQLFRRSSDAKKLVGYGYFPGGDALAIAYDTGRPQDPSVGPVISTSLVQWSTSAGGPSFFLLQDGGYPASVSRAVGMLRASAWVNRNKLHDSGPALVPRTDRPWGAEPVLGQPAVATPPNRTISSLDDLLGAYVAGAFSEVTPRQLREQEGAILRQVTLPLLTAQVVHQTIRKGLLSRLDSGWLKWIVRGWLRERVVRLGQTIARIFVGDDEQLAVSALKAPINGLGLGTDQTAARVFGYDAGKARHRAVLLAMGRDAAVGRLHYDHKARRMIADLDLTSLAPGYARQESLMRDLARQLGGELRTNPAWEFLHKPISVHNQGGCRMADGPLYGVTDPFGKVHACDGLYVLDGSILCRSVGVNPSATIAALAEHGVLHFIRQTAGKSGWPAGDSSPGAIEYGRQKDRAAAWAVKAEKDHWAISPPPASPPPERNLATVGLRFQEEMNGYYSEADRRPRDDAAFLALETRGRPEHPVQLKLNLQVDDLIRFYEDPTHRIDIDGGSVHLRLPGRDGFQGYAVTGGKMDLLVRPSKPYALRRQDRINAFERITGRAYASVPPDDPRLRERLMNYEVHFLDDVTGTPWTISGYKRIAATSTLEAWRQTAILHLTLSEEKSGSGGTYIMRGAGAAHLDLTTFLFEQLPSFQATNTDDPARRAWAIGEFTAFFFGTLQRIYLPALRLAARRSAGRRHLLQDQP